MEYFELCARFWELEDGRLDAWKSIVIKSGMPKFGANLVYALDDWRVENWANLGF